MTSVLKGPLSGPSHREVAGVEFGGRSGNASHLDFCLCRRGGGGGEGSFLKDLLKGENSSSDTKIMLKLCFRFAYLQFPARF